MKTILWLVIFLILVTGCDQNTGQTIKDSATNRTKEEQKKLDEIKEKEKGVVKEKAKADATGNGQENQGTIKKQLEQDSLVKSYKLVPVKIGRVIDGDTIVTSDGKKVRLIGVNTPESTTRIEQYGKEASKFTSSKLSGMQVWMQKDVSETDRYGRLLRIIWLEIPTNDMDENEIRTKMFNADLVLNGYAEPSTYPPDVKYSEFFVKFSREAKQGNKGLWALGQEGTTKGDLDSSTAPNRSAGGTSSGSISNSGKDGVTEIFANCTELRKKYPRGVPSTHPAYQSKMDRDHDKFACEK